MLPISVLRFLLVAGCLLFPFKAAAGPVLSSDFDGDGRRDHVASDPGDPHKLRIWLSGSNSTQIIRIRGNAQEILAVDLDGDRRPELIWRDNSPRIHVWAHSRGKFSPLHAHRGPPARPAPHPSTTTGDDSDDPVDGLTRASGDGLALLPSLAWRTSTTCEISRQRSTNDGVELCRRVLPTFVPRPPPVSTPL